MKNFSLYNIRKAARTAQNAILSDDPKQPGLQAIRAASTNDGWGPSTAQLEDVLEQCQKHGTYAVMRVLFQRVSDYLNAGDRPSNAKGFTGMWYHSAVHYVNAGSEWRILLKCLKIVEYLIIWDENGANEAMLRKHQLEAVVEQYQETIKKAESLVHNNGAVTTAQLQTVEHTQTVVMQAEIVLKLLDDPDYLQKQQEVAVKMDSARDQSTGNGAKLVKEHAPAYMKDFKEKTLDRGKLQNSNVKAEVRNQIGHIIHTKKRLPGAYATAEQGGTFSGSQVVFDEGEADYYDDGDSDVAVDTHSALTHENATTDEDDNDDFGVFQEAVSPTSPQDQLISFDEPATPTVDTLSSIFSSQTLTQSTPQSIKPEAHTFEDLFSSAKS